ncbi:MAG: protein jag [Clostridiales bacterium]|nr:protein jag [Clostridiales bacterium]
MKMSRSIIVEGKTSNEAIEKGLRELNAKKDDVEIKILEEENKRSFYSILSPRVVKVELTLKENINNKEDKNVQDKVKKNINNNLEEINYAVKEVEGFLKKLLDNNIEIKVEIKEFNIFVDLNGENINYLIGYRGENINALQVILTAVANKNSSAKIRVMLDVGGYKEKREKTLEDLAEKIAKTVIRTRKQIALEPMTAYERKIIHSKLQSNNKVETFSKGEEPHRRIVVSLKK